MKKCALVIGHSDSSQGASNLNSSITEYFFNNSMANDIAQMVRGVEVVIVFRDSYNQLPNKINKLNPDFIISLHCNAYNAIATGTEVLYYHSSKNGKNLANELQRNLMSALGLYDRGIKSKHSEDRGGYLLKYTNAPCVIAEPFFIDNDKDLEIANSKIYELIKSYTKTIEIFAENL